MEKSLLIRLSLGVHDIDLSNDERTGIQSLVTQKIVRFQPVLLNTLFGLGKTFFGNETVVGNECMHAL